MARILCCVHCRTVLEEIRLGSRRAVVICISCDLIGDAREVALGARLVAAGFDRGRKSARGKSNAAPSRPSFRGAAQRRARNP